MSTRQMTIIDGYRLFPQNQTITLNIEGGKFTGHFANSDTFIIVSREHPDYELNPPSQCGPVDDRYYTVTAVLDQSDWQQTESGSAWYDATVYKGSSGGTDIDPREVHDFCNTIVQTKTGRASVGGPAASQKKPRRHGDQLLLLGQGRKQGLHGRRGGGTLRRQLPALHDYPRGGDEDHSRRSQSW